MELDQIDGFQTWVGGGTLCIPTTWSSEQGLAKLHWLKRRVPKGWTW